LLSRTRHLVADPAVSSLALGNEAATPGSFG
jgi:hypothetical protein